MIAFHLGAEFFAVIGRGQQSEPFPRSQKSEFLLVSVNSTLTAFPQGRCHHRIAQPDAEGSHLFQHLAQGNDFSAPTSLGTSNSWYSPSRGVSEPHPATKASNGLVLMTKREGLGMGHSGGQFVVVVGDDRDAVALEVQ